MLQNILKSFPITESSICFKFKLVKLNKINNLVPQSHSLHFKCPVFTGMVTPSGQGEIGEWDHAKSYRPSKNKG